MNRDNSPQKSRSAQRSYERREKGIIACAECRRLKLKCDRKLPCTSCVKRHCQDICPNGVLTASQRSRFERIQQSVTILRKRIAQLEEALQFDHSAISREQHPLLTDELLQIKNIAAREESASAEANSSDDEADEHLLPDAFGFLSMNDNGSSSKFVGTSGSEQIFFMVDSNETAGSPTVINGIDDAVTDINEPLMGESSVEMTSGQSWIFSANSISKGGIHRLLSRLPSWQRALELCNSFMSSFCWWTLPVTHDQLFNELLPNVYRRDPTGVGITSTLNDAEEARGRTARRIPPVDPHDLGLVFAVLACGAHTDFSLPFCNSDTLKFRQLSLDALSLKPVVEYASVSAVQTCCLLTQLDVQLGRDNSLESSWRLVCLGLSLCTSVGLHRDPTRWGLDPKLVQRRRWAFWSLYNVALWRALSTGKPLNFAPDTIDCEYPDDEEAFTEPDGTRSPSNWRSIHIFTKEIQAPLVARVCAIKPPKYSEIREFDRKVIAFETMYSTVGAAIKRIPEEQFEKLDRQTKFRFRSLGLLGSLAMMYIHRRHFAHCLNNHADEPMSDPCKEAIRSALGKYLDNPAHSWSRTAIWQRRVSDGNLHTASSTRSFIAAYGFAVKLLNLTKTHFRLDPDMTLRCWPCWEHSVTATIVIGSVATLCTGSELAANAREEFDLAIACFQSATAHPFVKRGLPVLLRIREKFMRESSVSPGNINTRTSRRREFNDIDLDIFRGTTRVVLDGGQLKVRDQEDMQARVHANALPSLSGPSNVPPVQPEFNQQIHQGSAVGANWPPALPRLRSDLAAQGTFSVFGGGLTAGSTGSEAQFANTFDAYDVAATDMSQLFNDFEAQLPPNNAGLWDEIWREMEMDGSSSSNQRA
ncbi:hypothetical protein SCHPADRAFT_999838 [Schizopora paradoxa]|uniref:Zn(2)-C6 fungal-type domain-containing protein n=1 Tax=Schizopora paradoxa TaxID=27342 RepID=A0A0H2RZ67_9AGAM|nr:hypothetical protein SCHPADRAFT_999838 [Schizopora paradoxa]